MKVRERGGWVLLGAFVLASCTAPEGGLVQTDARELASRGGEREDRGEPPAPVPDAPFAVAAEGFDGPITVVARHGLTLFEGDIQVVVGKASATVAGKRWLARTVPYVIDEGFVDPGRVHDAIAHWEAKTSLRFVPRTTQGDYLRFTLGRGCSSHVGRVGGAQAVTLVAGIHIRSLVGADFDPSTNRAVFFWRNGYRTVGRSADVAEHELQRPYAVAAGKAHGDLLEVATDAAGKVHAFYRDGTFSVGTLDDLAAHAAPQPFALPVGYRADHVVGAAFEASGKLRAWFSNGATSLGAPSSLAADEAPRAFAPGAGLSASDVLAVGSARGGAVYAWYGAGKASGGTSTDLGATYAPYAVKTLGHCGVGQVVHELGHAVGLFHEQTRLDRDDFITIDWNNIADGHSYNFQKHGAGADHGAYDYDSVMHYDSWAFSKNGQPTIRKKSGGTIADPDVLSAGDVAAIAWMYP